VCQSEIAVLCAGHTGRRNMFDKTNKMIKRCDWNKALDRGYRCTVNITLCMEFDQKLRVSFFKRTPLYIDFYDIFAFYCKFQQGLVASTSGVQLSVVASKNKSEDCEAQVLSKA